MDIKQFTSLDPVRDLPQLTALLERPRPTDAFGKERQGSWFRIQNLSSTEVEVYIYDDIGAFGISADDFVREFSDIRASRITVRINSDGGIVSDGVSIYNAIRRHRANVTTIVDGMAASIASFIMMAGDKIVMSPHSQMLIHDALGLAIGDAETAHKLGDMLDKTSDDIASLYAARTGGTIEQWRSLMKATTLFSAIEAVEMGLADEIDGEDAKAVAARAEAKIENHDDPPSVDYAKELAEINA